MKFAICNETFQDWPFDKAFGYARELGYEGIEIAPFTINPQLDQITPELRRQVRHQAEQAGLQVIGLHWLLASTQGLYLTSPEADTRRRTGAYLSDLAILCRELGGGVMVLGSPAQRNLLPSVTHRQAMQYAAEVIQLAVPTLHDQQVVLAIEPLGPAEGDFLNTASAAIELIETIDSPQVQLHLDVKAMSSEQKPIPEIIRDSASYLAHFHANDPNRRGPGMGDVDFGPIFQALRDIDYQKWVSVEVFDYEPGIESLATDSLRYMQKCLK